MDAQVLRLSSDTPHFAAYDRGSVERFLLRAFQERERLLGEIAAGRRRITAATAELAAGADAELRCVSDVQRVLREEQRATDEAIRAITSDAEAESARILASSGLRPRALRPSPRVVSESASARDVSTHSGQSLGGTGAAAGHLTPPEVVDVIRANEIDPAVTSIRAELAELERELTGVVTTADRLERQASAISPRADGDPMATVLEGIFSETVVVIRADHRRALERAEEDAERRIASARARADRFRVESAPMSKLPAVDAAEPPSATILPTLNIKVAPGAATHFEMPARPEESWAPLTAMQASNESGSVAPAPNRPSGDAVPPPPSAPAPTATPSWDPPTGAPVIAESRVATGTSWDEWADPAPPAFSRTYEPISAFADEPGLFVPAPPNQARPSQLIPLSPITGEDRSGLDTRENAGIRQRTWRLPNSSKPPIAKPMVLDIVLPLIAVAIVLVIVLSWLG